MAQKRQRSKQRQAERRAQRLSERGTGPTEAGGTKRAPESSDGADGAGRDAELRHDAEFEENVDLQVGAPPEELGHPEFTARHEDPPAPDFEVDDEELFEDADSGAAPPSTRGPRGVRGGGDDRPAAPGEPIKERGGARLLEFLKAVWAELKRVQWPNRRQLFQLTGVVLFFIVVVGAYLGALDAALSRIIQTIL